VPALRGWHPPRLTTQLWQLADEVRVKQKLERAVAEQMGKPFGVLLRTAEELQTVLENNPFPKVAPHQVLVLFLDAPDSVRDIPIPGREKLVLLGRELFIHYPDGMGRSKLKVSFQKTGTGRNLNTAKQLVAMLQGLA